MQNDSHQLSLKLMHQCPSCRKEILKENINVLAETHSDIFAHISCAYCMNNYFTHIEVSERGIIGNALVTDLTFDEALNVLVRDPITEDEFLQLYDKISKNNLIESLKLTTNSNNRKEL